MDETSQVNRTCANLSHACVRDSKVLWRARACYNKTEKNVRATPSSVFTTRRAHVRETLKPDLFIGNLVGP